MKRARSRFKLMQEWGFQMVHTWQTGFEIIMKIAGLMGGQIWEPTSGRHHNDTQYAFPEYRRHTGGGIPGYGGNVPSMLERGEFVVRKEAVSKYGAGFFSKLNSMMPGAGGQIGGPSDDRNRRSSGPVSIRARSACAARRGREPANRGERRQKRRHGIARTAKA